MINTAEQKFTKGSEEWMMFQEYYQIVQRFYLPEESDKYWGGLHDALTTFGNEYGRFAKKLALAYMNEMESKLKDGK